MKKLVILFTLAIITGCSFNNDIKTGSMIDRNGTITDRSTSYTFQGVHADSTVKRLFADIYFKGDMLCFSVNGMGNISLHDITVTYVHPPSGHVFKAERLEKNGSCIWGFSLIGSLLEAFFPDELYFPAAELSCKGKDIPVVVKMEWKNMGKTISREKSLSFHITY